MDIKLRSGNKDCTEEELDHVMDDVILLFRFIQGTQGNVDVHPCSLRQGRVRGILQEGPR